MRDYQVSPTKIARKVLLGAALGDGYLPKPKSKKKPQTHFYYCHSIKAVEYLIWKAQLLKPLIGNYHLSILDDGRWNSKARVCMNTKSSKYLAHIAKDVYTEDFGKRRKKIRLNVLRRLTPLSIAIWYFDDGCIVRQKSKSGNKMYGARLYTNRYPLEEQEIIVSYFKDIWDISFDILYDKRSDSYFLNLNKEEGAKFLVLIAPSTPTCMLYKLNPALNSAELSEKIGDMFRSLQQCKELVRNAKQPYKKLKFDWKPLLKSDLLPMRLSKEKWDLRKDLIGV